MRLVVLALSLVLFCCQASSGGGGSRKPKPTPTPQPDTQPAPTPQPKAQSTNPAPSSEDPLTPAVRVKVIEVLDGNTIKVRMDGRNRKVRLLGIAAPKADSSKKEEQYFGKESKAYLSGEILDRAVKLRFVAGHEKDRFERYLAFVLIEGKDLNAKMIKKGYAWARSDEDHPREEEYEVLEKEARRKKKGMWARGVAAK